MNRRHFLGLLAIGAPAAAAISTPSATMPPSAPERWIVSWTKEGIPDFIEDEQVTDLKQYPRSQAIIDYCHRRDGIRFVGRARCNADFDQVRFERMCESRAEAEAFEDMLVHGSERGGDRRLCGVTFVEIRKVGS